MIMICAVYRYQRRRAELTPTPLGPHLKHCLERLLTQGIPRCAWHIVVAVVGTNLNSPPHSDSINAYAGVLTF